MQDSSSIVTSATGHMSKAACMFICRLRTEECKFSSENCTNEAEKPGYFKPSLYWYLPLLQFPVCFPCHQCWQGKDIILVSNMDKLKQCKWWLFLSSVRLAMGRFTNTSYKSIPRMGSASLHPRLRVNDVNCCPRQDTAQGQGQTPEDWGLRLHTLWMCSSGPVIILIS